MREGCGHARGVCHSGWRKRGRGGGEEEEKDRPAQRNSKRGPRPLGGLGTKLKTIDPIADQLVRKQKKEMTDPNHS